MLDFSEPRRTSGEDIIQQARSAMTTANNASPQSRLWTGRSINCSAPPFEGLPPGVPAEPCLLKMKGRTFGNMSTLPDPFLAQLPSNYSTGVIRQYLPRINSTAHRQVIAESEFPADCDKLPGAFYVRYAATNPNYIISTGWGNWSLVACMPADLNRSPWIATRDRQEFSEELYLAIDVVSADPLEFNKSPQARGGYFRITVNTTAGYFELPNYANGQAPGPLLDKDPMPHCGLGTNCSTQYSLLSTLK